MIQLKRFSKFENCTQPTYSSIKAMSYFPDINFEYNVHPYIALLTLTGLLQLNNDWEVFGPSHIIIQQ